MTVPQTTLDALTTAAALTPGWASMTSSTSCGATFSPPVLIMSRISAAGGAARTVR